MKARGNGKSIAFWASIPGRVAGYPNGSPTDPDERHERIRFLRSRFRCVHGVHDPGRWESVPLE
jgi:hypothetical protein